MNSSLSVLADETRNFHKSLYDTVDLNNKEVIKYLGGADAMLKEVLDYLKKYPEMEHKLDHIIKLLEMAKINEKS